jgi:hypothetical protein
MVYCCRNKLKLLFLLREIPACKKVAIFKATINHKFLIGSILEEPQLHNGLGKVEQFIEGIWLSDKAVGTQVI